jgi:hypothetical protein
MQRIGLYRRIPILIPCVPKYAAYIPLPVGRRIAPFEVARQNAAVTAMDG